MSNEGYFWLAIGLILATVVYILLHNRESIRLYFASSNQRRAALEQSRLGAQRNKEGMEEYERQVIIDILRDQLAHSREANSDLEKEIEKLIAKVEALEAKIITKIEALEVKAGRHENGLGQINNRLDTYRLLLTKSEDRDPRR